jgi:hypothetical protein
MGRISPMQLRLPHTEKGRKMRIWLGLFVLIWGLTGVYVTQAYADFAYMSGVSDYQQPFVNSCGPTSGAVVLDFWGMGGYYNIPDLAQAMGWTPEEGVWMPGFLDGMRRFLGEDFTVQHKNGPWIDLVRAEIDRSRIVLFRSSGPENPWQKSHIFVVVGCDGDTLITRDTWWTTPKDFYVAWDSLGHEGNTMITVVPFRDDIVPTPSGESLGPTDGGDVSKYAGGCFLMTVRKSMSE